MNRIEMEADYLEVRETLRGWELSLYTRSRSKTASILYRLPKELSRQEFIDSFKLLQATDQPPYAFELEAVDTDGSVICYLFSVTTYFLILLDEDMMEDFEEYFNIVDELAFTFNERVRFEEEVLEPKYGRQWKVKYDKWVENLTSN